MNENNVKVIFAALGGALTGTLATLSIIKKKFFGNHEAKQLAHAELTNFYNQMPDVNRSPEDWVEWQTKFLNMYEEYIYM
jgi:hypothetical protein